LRAHKRSRKRLERKARRGFRGYPVGTVALYGPDNKRASKVAVGVVLREDAEPVALERWFSEQGDVRQSAEIAEQILAFLELHSVLTVVMTDRIIGCPHEEGIDYAEGATCPQCPFWEGRDRWAGV
jgi:hypothetical protein